MKLYIKQCRPFQVSLGGQGFSDAWTPLEDWQSEDNEKKLREKYPDELLQKKDAWSVLKFQYRYVEQDFRDIDRYLNCLDDMADFLDEEDELGGLPDGVLEAQEKLYEYFVVLYRLRKKQHKI